MNWVGCWIHSTIQPDILHIIICTGWLHPSIVSTSSKNDIFLTVFCCSIKPSKSHACENVTFSKQTFQKYWLEMWMIHLRSTCAIEIREAKKNAIEWKMENHRRTTFIELVFSSISFFFIVSEDKAVTIFFLFVISLPSPTGTSRDMNKVKYSLFQSQ